MCGICGYSGFNDDGLVDRMLDVMAHRGPDDSGVYRDATVTLGHNRLSIIDLIGGKQPIANEDGSVVVMCNGEIYNYQALGKELSELGHRFRTRSDTEVIVHAYEQYGIEFPEKLDGMFAIAVWDTRRKRLVLARDRLGIKPLYYIFEAGRFAFASELKAIIKCRWLERRLNMPAVFSTLAYRYTHNPDTVIEGVNKLRPAHYLVYEGSAVRESAYWVHHIDGSLRNDDEVASSVRNTLRESVRSHLVSDVPVGVMLSGGLDSSCIVAFASEYAPRIRTYSIGFEGAKDNEVSYARQVAEQFGTDHQEIFIKPGNISILPEIIWHNDEPVGGPSSLAYYLMLREARKDVKVVLFGHGADEIFGGYEQMKIQKIARALLSTGVTRWPARVLSRMISAVLSEDDAFARLYRYIKSMGDPALNYYELMSVMNTGEVANILRSPWKERVLESGILGERHLRRAFDVGDNHLQNILSFEANGWLSDDINLRLDRMTMSASIEARVPFLDHHLVDLAGRIDIRCKLRGFQDKYCLRESVRGILPREIVERKKQRFNTPVDRFFGGRFDRLCNRLLSEKNVLNETLFDVAGIRRLLAFRDSASYKYVLRRQKLAAQFYARQLWNVVVFQLWHKMYIEDKSPGDLAEYFVDTDGNGERA